MSDENLTLSQLRNDYFENKITRENAIALYPEWMNTPVYATYAYLPSGLPVWDMTVGTVARRLYHTADYYCIKLSKRGNDVYRFKIRNKLQPLRDLITVTDDIKFLTKKNDLSNLLFVTLTYDSKLTDKDTAYKNIGIELNKFLSSLKQKYGKLSLIRCFESFKTNGYPHIHAIIYFKDHKFPVSRYRNKKGNIAYRVSNNSQDTISSYWHSFVHIDGIQSTGAIGYLLKYITKNQYIDSSNTIGHLWFYHKQSYSISKQFYRDLTNLTQTIPVQLDTIPSNSNNYYSNKIFLFTFQTHNEHKNWRFDVVHPPPCKTDYSKESLCEYFTSIY